ncbi:hypothetical protein FJT64_023799 [Amphibalanus amphitrite]|uniref:Tyr recombinase domain-containing protein n=1 Tax=Amphibalanus amphitrite TaxID=1232801 RepID=A0A6A4WCK7_AMPAM|nr:hypothetical protein FJT64_023799 [Amphibalanus amphitrite]
MSESDYDTDYDSQELLERNKDAQPKNTRKTTSWAVSVFRRWAARRSRHDYVKPDLLDYGTDASALNRTLFKFYSEVHTVEGHSLTPSSFHVLRAGLQRYLTDHHSECPLNISDDSFKKANEAFKAAKRRYALSGDNPQAGKQKQPIDPADQEKIRQYFVMQDTFENPKKLQEFVYYMLSMHFGYRGSEIWHQLKHRSFKDDLDEHGRPRLKLDQAISEKNYQHTGPQNTCRQTVTIADDPEAQVYMYTTLKTYIGKLDPRQDAFLAKPKTAAQMEKDKDGPWYVNAPVGVKSIANIMPEISRKAGTSKRYTNHCVRHTLGTNMMRMGFPLPAIQARLRLRSAATLNWYTGYKTADELQKETRTISAPLKGVQCPPAAGRSTARPPDDEQQPSTSRAVVRPAAASQQLPDSGERGQTPPAPAAEADEAVGDRHLQQQEAQAVTRPPAPAVPGVPVVPLHLADLTRPPPPIPVHPAFRVGYPTAPTKVFSGQFHNCVFY